eukprot:Phypoly_transcript_01511.p1 GENE.Phypoly_transcript_01511~~Phypoly_transcript_01511.p1  ORF type:complete len:869 (+),score=113.34 Phypoly_transcript_01511:214-2820(+)
MNSYAMMSEFLEESDNKTITYENVEKYLFDHFEQLSDTLESLGDEYIMSNGGKRPTQSAASLLLQGPEKDRALVRRLYPQSVPRIVEKQDTVRDGSNTTKPCVLGHDLAQFAFATEQQLLDDNHSLIPFASSAPPVPYPPESFPSSPKQYSNSTSLSPCSDQSCLSSLSPSSQQSLGSPCSPSPQSPLSPFSAHSNQSPPFTSSSSFSPCPSPPQQSPPPHSFPPSPVQSPLLPSVRSLPPHLFPNTTNTAPSLCLDTDIGGQPVTRKRVYKIDESSCLSKEGRHSTKDDCANSGLTTPNDETILVENNETTRKLFQWVSYGKKKVKQETGVSERKYFKCREWKQLSCSARVKETNSGMTLHVDFRDKHNHSPPEKRGIQDSMRERVYTSLADGATPGTIRHNLVTMNPGVSITAIPSAKQISNVKHYAKLKARICDDPMENLKAKHEGSFVITACGSVEVGDLMVIMASTAGKRLLINAKDVIVDGSHGTVRGGVTLTTLHAVHDGIAQPCAYMLALPKTTKTYTVFYETINSATTGRMAPQRVYLDFEDALGNAFQKVFSGVTVLRDHFHFKQALVRHAGHCGLKHMASEFAGDTNELFYAETKGVFDSILLQFVKKWDTLAPTLITYFRANFLERWPPAEWACYGRSSNALTGSSSAESFHRSLKSKMVDAPKRLDEMVDFLNELDAFYARERNDPESWRQIKDAHSKSQDRHSAQYAAKVSAFIDRRSTTNNSRVSADIDLFDLESLEDKQALQDKKTLIIDLSCGGDDVFSDTKPTTTTTTTSVPFDSLLNSQKTREREQCRQCKTKDRNAQCTFQSCSTCCATRHESCSVTTHQRKKVCCCFDLCLTYIEMLTLVEWCTKAL